MTAKTEIGAYEAKNRLPELLREVRAGRRFTITIRGEAVADLVPSASGAAVDAAAAIDRFRAFMRDHPLKAKRRVDVQALVKAKGFVEEAQSEAFLEMLASVAVRPDDATFARALTDTLPLATLDAGLSKAARKAGVKRFGPH